VRAELRATSSSFSVSGLSLTPGAAASIRIGGRRVWTFRVPEAAAEVDGLEVGWPPALADRLRGHAHISLLVGESTVAEGSARFGDTNDEMQLVEPGTGIPQVVNKWGRIARSFEDRAPGLIEEVLTEAARLVAFAKEKLDVDLFVTGGTLLGPVRNGRILAHDDDADLAYLSRHENPSDVALESYAIERALTDSGYEVIRHSTGHLQLMFPGDSRTDRYYIDIFSYFVCNGYFYGTFHARERAEEVPLLPTRPIDVNGITLPAPADPSRLLSAIYGPGWRVPDPTFSFVTPPAAARRYFSWLSHFDYDRENWEDLHRAQIESGPSRAPSEFARQVGDSLPKGSLVELGSGLGQDARHFASLDRTVIAADYSRPALLHARATSAEDRRAPDFRRANLAMHREAVQLLEACSALDGPVHLFARGLFNALSPQGWDVTLTFARHLLSAGGLGFFEVEVGEAPPRSGWHSSAPVDAARFHQQLDSFGLQIEHQSSHAGTIGSTIQRVTVRSRP